MGKRLPRQRKHYNASNLVATTRRNVDINLPHLFINSLIWVGVWHGIVYRLCCLSYLLMMDIIRNRLQHVGSLQHSCVWSVIDCVQSIFLFIFIKHNFYGQLQASIDLYDVSRCLNPILTCFHGLPLLDTKKKSYLFSSRTILFYEYWTSVNYGCRRESYPPVTFKYVTNSPLMN